LGKWYFVDVELGPCPVFCGHGSDEKLLYLTAGAWIFWDKDREVVPKIVVRRTRKVGMIPEAAFEPRSLPDIIWYVVSVKNVDPRLTQYCQLRIVSQEFSPLIKHFTRPHPSVLNPSSDFRRHVPNDITSEPTTVFVQCTIQTLPIFPVAVYQSDILFRMTVNDILSSIDAEIASLQRARALLSGKTIKPAKATKAAAPKKRRKLSAEARKKIADAQKRRWAAQKAKKA
jgi:hypothetical protein